MPIVLIATPKANHDTFRKNWLSPQGHLTIVPVYNGCPCWLYLGFRVYSRCWLFDFHFVFYFLYSWACVCHSIFFKIFSPCLLTRYSKNCRGQTFCFYKILFIFHILSYFYFFYLTCHVPFVYDCLHSYMIYCEF